MLKCALIKKAHEARWLFHRIMLHAMTDIHAPATRQTLDSALNHALRRHRANAA